MPDGGREARGWGERRTLIYRGSSMYPTFRELDVLSYQDDVPLRAGDVIAFSLPGLERITVHRIARISGRDLVTQGDNSSSPDLDPVPPACVLGRIHSFSRNGVVRTVRGGGGGLAYAMGCHLFHRFRPIVVGIVGPVYRRLVAR